METAAGTRHGLHSTPARTPRNAKSGKCDESGMGRDESGKSIGHLAKATAIEPMTGTAGQVVGPVRCPIGPHREAVNSVDRA